MTRTTSELRQLWAPACEGPWARIELYGAGVVSVDPLIVPAVKALDACLRAAKYETRRGDTGAFNCRHITGGTGYSLHAYGIALDLNWSTNPYGPVLHTDMPAALIEAVERIRTKSGAVVWRWGGRYKGNKDAMHYEVVCSPAELATGIDPATVPGGTSKPATPPVPTEEQELMGVLEQVLEAIKASEERLNARIDRLAVKATVVRDASSGKVYVVDDDGKLHVSKDELNFLLLIGQAAPWPNSAKGTTTIPKVDPKYLDGLPDREPPAELVAKREPAPPADGGASPAGG